MSPTRGNNATTTSNGREQIPGYGIFQVLPVAAVDSRRITKRRPLLFTSFLLDNTHTLHTRAMTARFVSRATVLMSRLVIRLHRNKRRCLQWSDSRAGKSDVEKLLCSLHTDNNKRLLP
jgi:hypothetical protein